MFGSHITAVTSLRSFTTSLPSSRLSTLPRCLSTAIPRQAVVQTLLPVVYHPLYSAPQLSVGHRFPMPVFQRIFDTLISQGVIHASQVYTPDVSTLTKSHLHLAHCPAYIDAFCSGSLSEQQIRRIGFQSTTSTPILIERTKSEVAGTLLTAQLALKHKLAVNTAGGTHHAHYDSGSGYCIINDLAVTTEYLLKIEKSVNKVLILDLDVHQGDGTAAIFQGRSDVFTLSVHAQNNFPARKQCSHLDVALPDDTGDDEYLAAVADALNKTLTFFQPDLVLYDAGVDVHRDDVLGRLNISDAGLERREALVLDTCLAMDIPVAGLVGGGYADDLDVLARRHCWMHKVALQMWDVYGLAEQSVLQG